MNRRTAVIASSTSIVALALVALLVIPGFSAESPGNPHHDTVAAEGDSAASPVGDMHSDMAMPGNCGMANMPEDCNMENMPEQCQQMMANGCMGSEGMMSMHHNSDGMMSMHHNSDGMMGMRHNSKSMHGMKMNCMNRMGEGDAEATRGMHEDAHGMAACPMTGHAAADNTEKPAQ